MLKKTIFALVFITLFSCSTEEDEGELFFTVAVMSTCPGGLASSVEYCVSESTYQNTKKSMDQGFGQQCIWVSFKDLSLQNRSGYVNGISKTSSNSCE